MNAWLTLSPSTVVRYLAWLSINAKTFNVGAYRRIVTPNPSANFFDTSNPEGEQARKAAAEAAVADMIKWFNNNEGLIAVLDATNSTKARRRWIQDECDKAGIETLFVESKCDDDKLIMSNIKEVKMTSPDYVGQDPEVAAQDFRERIRNYEAVYQTIDEDEKDLTYCKLIDVGGQVIINRLKDYLQSRVVYYLMNLHIKPRSIWLSRVSLSVLTPDLHLLNYLISTANQNSTSVVRLVATQTSLSAVKCTPRSYPISSGSLLETVSSPSGSPP